MDSNYTSLDILFNEISSKMMNHGGLKCEGSSSRQYLAVFILLGPGDSGLFLAITGDSNPEAFSQKLRIQWNIKVRQTRRKKRHCVCRALVITGRGDPAHI